MPGKLKPMRIAVLDKTFSLLEVLARTGRPLPLAELAAESRLPKPTAYRILRSLRDLGYVIQREAGGAYELSARLGSLREHDRDAGLRDKALPLMHELHAAFDETVNLGLLEGIYVRYAEVLETKQALRWIVQPGARDLFHTTALGRAVAAQLPEDQRERLVHKALLALPRARRTAEHARLIRELAATRRRGYAIEEGETVTGVACVAVSLAGLGAPLAAVSVAVPTHRFAAAQRLALINAVRQAGAPLAAHG
jgi:DNA-binding IclR family transcriptional regulator